MYVWWNKCTYLIMWICVFYNVRIRARWICPYAWRSVSWLFRGCSPRYRRPSAALSQTVSSRRGRFIVPAYTKTPTKWGAKMCVRWNKCTYFMKRICIFDNVEIRARWIRPYAWRSVFCVFRWWELCICGLFVAYFVGECGIFADCPLCISLREYCIIPICPQYFGSPFVAYCLCIYGLFE